MTLLATVIATLLVGAVAGVTRVQAPAARSGTPGPPVVASAEADRLTGAAPPGAAPGRPAPASAGRPPPTASGRPASGAHRDQPRGPDGVGSVADLGPGEVVSVPAAPCTPSSQPTPPHAVAVAELGPGCVRPLVPAGAWVGSEVRWSPDGSWLVATVRGRVVRLARDGSWHQDLGGGGQAELAVLSPDGARIAVVGRVPSGEGGQKDVVVVAAADGTGPTVHEQRVVTPPSWSPDSQVLALVSNHGADAADVLTLVGPDGRVRATRSFPDRGAAGGPARTAAPLGRPVLLPDRRVFLPAAVEAPGPVTGLWLDEALADVAGPQPPGELLFSEEASAPDDGTAIAYTAAAPGRGSTTPIRRFDLRTGQSATLAADGAKPSSSHRTNAVAFVPRSPEGTPLGLSVVDAAGTRRVWRHSGTGCICVPSGLPAWTADDAAVGLAVPR